MIFVLKMKKIIYNLTRKNPKLLNTIFNSKQKLKENSIRNFPKTYKKLRLEDFPINIQIQTTSFCNSRCIMCPYGKVWKKLEQGEMDWKLYKKIINECKEYNISKVVPFLMAEPLLDKRIFEIIDYTKNDLPNSNIEISSNGSLLDKECARKLANSPVDEITFNIQGIDKDTYERTMVGLNFEKTMNNINYFLDLEMQYNPTIKIEILTGAASDIEIKNIQDYWKDKGVIAEIHQLHDRAGNLKEKDVDFNKKLFSEIYGCIQDRHLKWIHILFNGDVILCCQDWGRKIILGNVKKNDIRDIWHSTKYENIRNHISSKNKSEKNIICKKCFFGVGKEIRKT